MALRKPRHRVKSLPPDSGPSSNAQPASNPASLAPGLLLALAVILPYLNSLSVPFIYDDLPAITENRHIRTLWPIWKAVFYTSPDGPITGRPIASLSVAINYALGGLNVLGYHLFNLAVHLASTLVLWGILRRTFSKTRLAERVGAAGSFLAFAVALIWAVHPLQTEAVTYIVQRTELLLGLFYLLTLYCAIRAWQSARPRFWIVAAVVSCTLGMGSKEAMISAPLMVLLYDVTLVSSSLREALRSHAKLYIGLAATWILLACLVITNPHDETIGGHLGLHWFDYLRTQAAIIVWYLRLCFWPHPLVISYQGWPIATSITAILPQGLLLVALFGLTVWGVWRRHPLALPGAWFFMILAPSSSVVPIVTEIAAERRMYLPLAAVVVVVVMACFELTRWMRGRLGLPRHVLAATAALALILTTAVLGCTTFLRNRDYETPRRIWLDAVAKRPDNYAALQNLVAVYLHEGDYQQALKTSERVLQLKPQFPEAYSARGSAYGHLGDFNRAIEECTRAIELKPSLADAYSNRSNAYAGLRDYERAVADCTKAIELKPDFAEAYVNRAVAHGGARRYAEAIADCTKAIEIDANCVEAYNNRGISHAAVRDYDRAIADYHQAIKIRSDYVRTYYNLAVAHYYLGQYNEARTNIAKCRQLGGTVNPAFLDAMHRAETQPTEGQ